MISNMEDPSCSGSTSSSHDQKLIEENRSCMSSKHLICYVCEKSFKQRSNLTAHLRVHTGEKPFTCNRCNKSFSEKRNLIRHYRVHTGEKPFTCDVCEKSFNNKSNLSAHQRLHTGEKPFTCNTCEKTFKLKSHLLSHQKSHTDEKPFSCNKCGKHFKHKDSLKKHVQVHDDQEEPSFSETEKCKTVRRHSRVRKGAASEKSPSFCEYAKTSALDSGKDCLEKSHVFVSYCNLCGEGLKDSRCHNEMCQMESEELDDVNLSEDAGKEVHEGMFAKDGIDSDEIPSENQASQELEFVLIKSEPDLDYFF